MSEVSYRRDIEEDTKRFMDFVLHFAYYGRQKNLAEILCQSPGYAAVFFEMIGETVGEVVKVGAARHG